MPAGMTTTLVEVGIALPLQLPGFSQAVLTAPVQFTVLTAAVSSFQGSSPFVGLLAPKSNMVLNFVRLCGNEFVAPGIKSNTVVPAAVPSDFQRSSPFSRFNALKKSVPFTAIKNSGVEGDVPG